MMAQPANPLPDQIAAIRSKHLYAGQENLTSKLESFRGGKNGNRFIRKRNSPSEPAQSAVLRAVVQISRENYFLTPYGNYDPNNKLDDQNITKAQLRFHVCAAVTLGENFPQATDDYLKFVKNLQEIRLEDARSSSNPCSCWQIEENGMLSVSHKLIIRREDEDEDEDDLSDHAKEENTSQDASNMLEDPLSFDGWPVDPESNWRRELNSKRGTHDICPMQAFSKDGKLIHPFQYEKKLAGAVVDLSFTLVHYNFHSSKKGGSSRLCLYMTELHVLVPPVRLPGEVVSGRKGEKIWYGVELDHD